MPPRLIRRKPLLERIASWLNPMDFLLWLSEEIETREWDSTHFGTQFGVAMNVLFLLARANSSASEPFDGDIFGDDAGSSWLSWFLTPIVWALVAFSCCNAVYALSRTRKYRLFHSAADLSLATPSAKRVRVQSSPVSSSPLRYLADLIASDSAESRAHHDKNQDVWELSVWDPLPVTLRLFCLFSPGHLLVHMLFLPLAPLDPQPSATVFNTVVVQILLSGQMLFFTSRFAQQAKDQGIVQREVMNEYETQFVQPRIHPTVRDVGTQIGIGPLSPDDRQSPRTRDLVQVGKPTTLVRHAFLSRPKPMLSKQEILSNPASAAKPQPQPQPPNNSPPPATKQQSPVVTPPSAANTRASIIRPSAENDGARAPVANAGYVSVSTAGTNTGSTTYGGHMGIYNHARSPLKKAAYASDFSRPEASSPRNSREMAAYEQRIMARAVSPTKQAELRRTTATHAANTGASTSSPFVRGGPRERQIPRW